MATYRLLNEFGVSSVVLALENANKCDLHCTYCFAELNKRAQWAGKTRRDEDPGSFERSVEKAMGPAYDPTDFRQWSIRNKMPIGWANTVEPFQDVPQAEALLGIIAKLDLPLFVQTKGHNFAAIWPTFRAVAENTVLFASFPSDDDRALKRFEVGAPRAADRLRMIEQAADAGMEVVLALAPYHEDWCADPGAHVRRALDAGAKHVFVDRLHLNDRQRGTATDPVMVGLADRTADEKFVDHLCDIHEAAADADASFYYNGRLAAVLGLPSTTPTFYPAGFPRRGTRWDYHRDAILHELESLTLDDPATGPVVVEWEEALGAMEREHRVDQPFSWRSMGELLVVKKLDTAWRRVLEPAATPAQYVRALWNSPGSGNPFWQHPDARVAVRPGPAKEPWRGPGGDVVMIFDPSYDSPGRSRVIEDIEPLARYSAGRKAED